MQEESSQDQNGGVRDNESPLAICYSESNADATCGSSCVGGGASGVTSVELGKKTPLGDLGPIVLNSDGTMSRIANWTQMTKAEQESTARVISARNAKRKAALEREQVAQQHKVEE